MMSAWISSCMYSNGTESRSMPSHTNVMISAGQNSTIYPRTPSRISERHCKITGERFGLTSLAGKKKPCDSGLFDYIFFAPAMELAFVLIHFVIGKRDHLFQGQARRTGG